MGASLGRTLWSLDFWPERETEPVCPGESICLRTGHPRPSICPPRPDHPPPDNKHTLLLCFPWAHSTRESLLVLGLPAMGEVSSGLALAFAPLPSPRSRGRPVLSGPASARPLTVGGGLDPAPHLWRHSGSGSASHLCQDLPSSTGCPQPLSRICTWHVVLHCVLGVFVATAGPSFTLAQAPG